MMIKEIYDLAIRMAIKADLRGEANVQRKLLKARERFAKLTGDERADFDRETLVNPYSDTRLYVKDPNRTVRRVMAGIDVEEAEIITAYELSKQKPVDLVMGHHPIGHALAGLHEVMHMQAEILATYGIPVNVAESLLSVRVGEVSRKLNPVNHNQALDIARLLNVDVGCFHTVTDNLVARFLQKLIHQKAKDLETVEDILKLLRDIPEYRQARKDKAGPTLFAGEKSRLAGRIALTEITGGTEGNPQIYEKISQAGVGTIIGMHMSEEHKKEAEKHHVNAIIAGHISSDSIGLNLLLDELEKRDVEVIPFGGLIRVRRYQKNARPSRKVRRRR